MIQTRRLSQARGPGSTLWYFQSLSRIVRAPVWGGVGGGRGWGWGHGVKEWLLKGWLLGGRARCGNHSLRRVEQGLETEVGRAGGTWAQGMGAAHGSRISPERNTFFVRQGAPTGAAEKGPRVWGWGWAGGSSRERGIVVIQEEGGHGTDRTRPSRADLN